MKMILFRAFAVVVVPISVHGCKTLSNSSMKSEIGGSTPYTRVWAGYRRRDITLPEFQKQLNNIPRDAKLNWLASPESWASVEKLTRTKPDMIALTHFESLMDYRNSIEVNAMWDILEPAKTISDQPISFTGVLAIGQSYYIVEPTSPWTTNSVMPMLIEATGQGFLESMANYLQSANSPFKKCSLNVALATCGSDFCSFWVEKKFASCGSASFAAEIEGFADVVSP